MKRAIWILILAMLASACGDTADTEGIHVEDTEAIQEPNDDEFRPYANVILTDGDSEERYSFYLDELEAEEPAFRGCTGEAVSICGYDLLAYCSNGEWLTMNGNAPIPAITNCMAFPDEWEAYQRVNCPLDIDQMIRIERMMHVTQNQGDYTQPAPDYFGDEPVRTDGTSQPDTTDTSGGTNPDSTSGDSAPTSTDGTTQPGADSTSGSSGSGGGELSGSASGSGSSGGGSTTTQPGQL